MSQTHAYARGVSDGEERAKQVAFKRAREKLTADGTIGVLEPWAWPIYNRA
jgi:hypothetical protein